MTSSSSSSPEIPAAISSDSQPEKFSYKHATHDEVLEELSSRFIVNLPEQELDSLERICFQVEQAHWFYEDFIREENPKLPTLPLKKFSAMLFHACPLLHRWRDDHEEAFNHFMQYKIRVPVCGAILLNDAMDKCVLVKGWKASSGWGFPKGKINQSEPPHVCAVREVLEETGYDLAGRIIPEDVLTVTIKEQTIYLYIVSGVPEDYPFQTKTRKEISKIEWFRLVDLPTWRRNKAVPGKFYLISPFINALKGHINQRGPRHGSRSARARRLPAPPLPLTEEEDVSTDDLSFVEPGGYAEYSDVIQESSSQSSSGDNGDPQTPSPQYIQAIPSAAPQIATLQPDTLDPHMARLLSSLTLSATATGPGSTPGNGLIEALPKPAVKFPSSPMEKTQLHPQFASVCSGAVSSNGLSQRLALSPQTNPPSTKRPGSRPSQATSINSTSPIPFGGSPLSPRSRGLVSRRTSSTADISPYLSRPFEPPSSAKTLRQIALLEAIANESEKITPTLSNRCLPPEESNVDIQHSAVPGQPALRTGAPSISSSPNDLRVIYSSHPATDLSSAMLPQPNGFLPSPYPQPSPYQFRPHTSNSYHPSIGYSPSCVINHNQGSALAVTNPCQLPFFPHQPPMLPHTHRPQYPPAPMIRPTAIDHLMQPSISSSAPIYPLPPPHLTNVGPPAGPIPMQSPGDLAGFNPHGSAYPNPLLSILNDKP